MPNGFAGLALLYFLGFCGFLLFKKLRIPLAGLLGSLFACVLLAISGNFPAAPVGALSSVCKVAIGIMVGRRMNRDSLKQLGGMAVPALLVSVWMIALSMISGVLLFTISGLPLSTALIGSVTGGVSEMAIFALSRHYDVATITVIGVTRLVTALFFTPWLAGRWAQKLGEAGRGGFTVTTPKTNNRPPTHLSRPELLLLVAVSFAGGILFDRLGVPAGLMLGALVASSTISLLLGRTYSFPPGLLSAAQVGIAIAIAQQFGPEQMAYMTQPRFILSLTLTTAFTISGTVLLAYILQRITNWPPLTCMLSASAGGLSQMVVVSEEMKADTLTISVLHLARYVTVISFMPLIITFFLP